MQAQSPDILHFTEDSFQQDFLAFIHVLTQQDTKHLYRLYIFRPEVWHMQYSIFQLCTNTPLHTYRNARHNHTNTIRTGVKRWLKYVHALSITIQKFRRIKCDYKSQAQNQNNIQKAVFLHCKHTGEPIAKVFCGYLQSHLHSLKKSM